MNRSIKVTALIIGLLVFVAFSHTLTNSTLEDIAPKKNETTEENDLTKPGENTQGKKVTLPEPLGSPDASVKVKVYVTTDNECDTSTIDGITEIQQQYGDNVYVEFGDLLETATMKEAQNAEIGCKSGLTINGKSEFLLPSRGLKGTIMLDGPIGQMNYDMEDVEAIIKHLLEQSGDPVSEVSAEKSEGPQVQQDEEKPVSPQGK